MTDEVTLKAKILGESSSVDRAMDSAGAHAQKTESRFHSLGKIAAGVFAGGALAEGARKAGEFLKGSVEAAVDDEASQRKLAIALKNTTGANAEQTKAVGEWLTKQSEAYGVSKDDLMPAYQRLAESTGSVTKAQRELTLAQNISAGTGKDLNTVSSALMKANNGTVSSLARLGLKTKDAKGNTLSLKDAMKGMAETFHGQAEARAKSLQGQMDRLHATLHETEVRVGDKIIPILTMLGAWFFAKGIPAIEEFSHFVGGQLHDAFSTAEPVIEKTRAAVENLHPVLDGVIGFMKKNPETVKAFVITLVALAAVIGVVTAVTAAWTAVMAANPIGIVVIALAALVAGFVYAYTHSEKFRTIVQGSLHAVAAAAQAFVSFFKSAWAKWGHDIMAVVTQAWGAVRQIVRGYLQIVSGLIKVFSGIIHGNWSEVWAGVKQIVQGAWNVIKGYVKLGLVGIVTLIKHLPALLGDLTGLLLDAGKQLIQGLIAGIDKMTGALLGKVSALAGKVSGAFKKAAGIFSPSRVFAGHGADLIRGLIKGIDSQYVPLQQVMGKITAYIQAQGQKLQSLLSARSSFAAGFQSFTSSLFGADYGTDANANAITPDVAGILAYQKQQHQQAAAVRANVQKLVKLGLSPALLKQLQAAGPAGYAQIAALATASRGQIRQLNAEQHATQHDLHQAGMAAGNAIYGREIVQTRNNEDLAKRIAHQLQESDHGKYTVIELDGHRLLVAIRKDNRVRTTNP